MIYNVYDRGGRSTEPYVATLLADEESDFHEIDVGLYSPGTSILVIDTGVVYMLNSQKEWIPLGDGGGGGGGGGHTHPATQITYDPTGTTLLSTNVQLAINELWTLIQSGGISGLHFIKVSTLPAPASADTKGIYLLDTDTDNIYEMWIVDITGATPKWIALGDTSIDLSNYYTKAQTNALLSGKQDKLTWDTTPTSGSVNPVTSNGIYEALQNVSPSLTFDTTPTAGSTNPVTSNGIYVSLQTKQDVLTFDNIPTADSNNPVKSGGVYTALAGKQDVLTFDTTPTDSSTNPVTSDGVYDALQTKQDTLTWDTTPTSGSTNPVTSNGIYEALQNVTPTNVHAALTQAQYDALTPAEKANGTEYFITDAQAEGDFSNIETRLHKMEANFIDVTPNLQMLDPASYVSITRVNDNQVDIIVHDEVTNKNWKVSVTSTGSGTTRSNPQYTITEVV